MRLRCSAIRTALLTAAIAAACIGSARGLVAQTVQNQSPFIDSLRFHGGTVEEFVQSTSRLDEGLNIVLRRGVKDLAMPPVDLKRVSRDDIVDLICALASNEEAETRVERVNIGSQTGAGASRVYVLALVRKLKDPDGYQLSQRLLSQAGFAADQATVPRTVQVISLKAAAQALGRVASSVLGPQGWVGVPGGAVGGLAGSGQPGGPGAAPGIAAIEEKSRNYNSVLTAIETALKFRDEEGEPPAEIKFHAESGLLFVRALPEQHALVQEVVDQLDGSASRRETAKEKELTEAIRDLREEIRALNNLGQMRAPMQGALDEYRSRMSNYPNRNVPGTSERKRYAPPKTGLGGVTEDPASDEAVPKTGTEKPQAK